MQPARRNEFTHFAAIARKQDQRNNREGKLQTEYHLAEQEQFCRAARTEKRGNDIVAMGGRVLNVTATGRDVAEARARAYDAVSRIHWQGSFFRKDIGWRALSR